MSRLPPTRRLDHEDPLQLDFEATVLAVAQRNAQDHIALDGSAFYPESGGQLADQGTLAGLTVTDVQIDDHGVIWHQLAEGHTAPPVGTRVEGHVDRARRRIHQALHTGQHMLSRALLEETGGETVSSRLGASACTLDLDLPAVEESAVARAEALVHAVIDDDRPVRVFFPHPDELPTLPLRRAPKVHGNVRVVDVGGFDLSPCGGTHCTRTAQVVGVTVTQLERYKGKIRVTFLAGRPAWNELVARSHTLVAVARSCSVRPLETPRAIEHLRSELAATRDALDTSRARWAEVYGASLATDAIARAHRHVVATLVGVPPETLRTLAAILTAQGLLALLASRGEDGLRVCLARPKGMDFDCHAWLQHVTKTHGGRGGGKPDHAEGRLPPTVDWPLVATLP